MSGFDRVYLVGLAIGILAGLVIALPRRENEGGYVPVTVLRDQRIGFEIEKLHNRISAVEKAAGIGVQAQAAA